MPAAPDTYGAAFSVTFGFPFTTSQMVRVFVPDPDANCLPSGLQATLKTESVCHVNVAWIRVSVGVGVDVGAWVRVMVGNAVAGSAVGGARVGVGCIAGA